jgi:hypothetical protein
MTKFKPFTKQNWILIRQYILITIGLFDAGAWKGFLLPPSNYRWWRYWYGAIVYFATGIRFYNLFCHQCSC